MILQWETNEGVSMPSHFGLMLIFAGFVSVIFATLMKDNRREQVRFGAVLLSGLVGAGVVLGWLMSAFLT